MPKPEKGEKKDEFLQRCMEMLVGQEHRNPDQAYAICNGLWANHHEKTMEEDPGAIVDKGDSPECQS